MSPFEPGRVRTRRVLVALPVLLLAFLVVACGKDRGSSLVILKVTEHGSAKVTDEALIQVLKTETDLDVRIAYDLKEETALDGLRDRSVDMAIIPSNTIVEGDDPPVRTLMPLLPRVLMILTRPGVRAEGFKDLVENHRVLYEDMSQMDKIFFDKLGLALGIDPEKVGASAVAEFRPGAARDSAGVYVGLTHLHNPLVQSLLDEGWSLFPLDRVSSLGHGSKVEGIEMSFPWAQPFIVPRSFYRGKPVEPVLTLAIADVLVSREDFNARVAYEVVQALMENRANLVRRNSIYSLLPTRLDAQDLSFPFHKGALYYLNRNLPSIWVRYANTLWPILSVIALVVGAMASFQRRLRRRRRERIGSYYADLMRIRNTALHGTSAETIGDLAAQLHRIRERAFEALHNNKLVADESFSIFLKLYQEISDEIQSAPGAVGSAPPGGTSVHR